MFGMNLNGVVSGSELRQVTKEIFGKAKGSGSHGQRSLHEEENPQALKHKKPAYSRTESKASKADYKQSGVEINEGLSSKVKSQAAIDRYGQLGFKNPNIKDDKVEGLFDLGEAAVLVEAYHAKKDKEGKNPFVFFEQLNNKEEVIEDKFSKSIFAL